MVNFYCCESDDPARFSSEQRAREGLPRDVKLMNDVQADERGCVIRLNSTYLDMIDRWHQVRGGWYPTMMLMMGIPAITFVCLLSLWALETDLTSDYPAWGPDIFLIIVLCVGLPVMAWRAKLFFANEFFGYTHYPVRFNRKTRMIHVFRHNGPGGVLSVPWDKAWFYPGHCTYDDSDLLDLRGVVLDGDTAVDTFAAGNFAGASDLEYIKQFWKFLVLYMEHGPHALPRDNSISTSPDPCFYNQLINATGYIRMAMPIPLIKWIFILMVAITRWLIMKTCKTPVWPPEIEAESTIDPHDPNVWKEPEFKWSDLFRQDPVEYEKYQSRMKRLGKLK